jgi:glyoxylase-like metal-dependent hydrolase (beta-lactamase superfamily II)
MIIKDLQVGMIGTNCYVLCDETAGVCTVIDPGDEARRVCAAVEETGCKLQFILLTHGHFDHTSGLEGLLRWQKVPVYIHRADVGPLERPSHYQYPAPADTLFYDEGDRVQLGSLEIEVFHTPGHSPGSVTLRVGDVLFTGDTLFRDSCGRTDLPGGSYSVLLDSLRRLYDLPGDYRVYPGHEAFSTLNRERQRNYFMAEAVRAR